MKNPISALDGMLLNGAQKIANGYNALTGRPTADLYLYSRMAVTATLSIGMPVSIINDGISNQNCEQIGLGGLFGILSVPVGFFTLRHVTQTYDMLLRESESNTRYLELAHLRKSAKALRISALAISTLFLSVSPVFNENAKQLYTGSAMFLLAAMTKYFIDTEQKPPRKSIVKEKLETLSARLHEIMLPAPQPVRASYTQ